MPYSPIEVRRPLGAASISIKPATIVGPFGEDRVDAVVRYLMFLRVPADHVAVERRRCFRIVRHHVVPDERAACAGLIVTPLLVGGRLKSCRR